MALTAAPDWRIAHAPAAANDKLITAMKTITFDEKLIRIDNSKDNHSF